MVHVQMRAGFVNTQQRNYVGRKVNISERALFSGWFVITIAGINDLQLALLLRYLRIRAIPSFHQFECTSIVKCMHTRPNLLYYVCICN